MGFVTGNEVLALSLQSGETIPITIPELPDVLKTVPVFRSLRPQLDRIVYQSRNFEFILINVPSGDMVTRLEVEMNVNNFPDWSPQGDYFVFEGFQPTDSSFRTSEIFIVDKNGDGGRQTNLSALFAEFRVHQFTWAPDQQHIAMWAKAALPGDTKKVDEWRL